MNDRRYNCMGFAGSALLLAGASLPSPAAAQQAQQAQAQQVTLDPDSASLAAWTLSGMAVRAPNPSHPDHFVVSLSSVDDAITSPPIANPKAVSTTLGADPGSPPLGIVLETRCGGDPDFRPIDTTYVPQRGGGAGGAAAGAEVAFRSFTVTRIPAGSCAIRWRLARRDRGNAYISSISITPWTAAELEQYDRDKAIETTAKKVLASSLQDAAADEQRQRLNASRADLLDRAYELAELARRASGIRAVALSMDLMRGRAELNDPSAYVDLDSFVVRAREIMPRRVGDVLARLAAKVLNGTARIATAVGGNALVQTVATIATGLPVGQLGGALSMEVAQYASRDDDIDVKKLRRKWGGDEAHVRAEYDSLTQLGALLTDLNAENQRLNGYAMRLDAVQSEAKAIRVLAERSLRSLLVLSGYGPDSADARLAPLLDPTLSLKRESPAFAALESRVTATFGAQTPSGNPRSADARRTEAFLAKVNAELDASASVRPRIEHLVCQMWQVYSSMTDDLSRTDVLADLSPDMARKWSDMARPLLSRVADAKASFNEAYGASGCS